MKDLDKSRLSSIRQICPLLSVVESCEKDHGQSELQDEWLQLSRGASWAVFLLQTRIVLKKGFKLLKMCLRVRRVLRVKFNVVCLSREKHKCATFAEEFHLGIEFGIELIKFLNILDPDNGYPPPSVPCD